MMKEFVLHQAMKTGYPPIDDEHQRLVDILNDFIESSDDKTTEDCYKRTRHFVTEFTQHLDREVKILRDLGFSGCDEHERIHGKIKSEINEILEKCSKNKCMGLGKEEFIRGIIWVFLNDALKEDLKAKSFLDNLGQVDNPL